MAKQKEQMSVVKKMMIALIGGLIVGIAFLLIRENVVSESTWNVINKILFQDITVEEGVGAVGIFYIVGQIFMRGLQLAIVPLVLVSLSLAMCSISNSTKLGRIAGKTLLGFFGFYVFGAFFGCVIAYIIKSLGFFNVTLPSEAVSEAATIDAFNPLATIVNAVPSNITEAFSTNNSIFGSCRSCDYYWSVHEPAWRKSRSIEESIGKRKRSNSDVFDIPDQQSRTGCNFLFDFQNLCDLWCGISCSGCSICHLCNAYIILVGCNIISTWNLDYNERESGEILKEDSESGSVRIFNKLICSLSSIEYKNLY